MNCSACGTENRPGRKFCSRCGTPLARACPACGAANEPDDSFCGECGSALEGEVRPPAPEAERRLVSVLFGDLVGFTPLSEERDPEAVRELLSRYFDTARRVIERYGGTVEKFIGDAVMAVWGTPIAREDDAERAVRAGLELIEIVAALGAEVGAPELALRVGVVTGEAAVTIGAEGEGMVAGDLVNTASRVQSAAAPGTVFVGERTRRATEAAIAYEDAGEHELKGKAEPVPLLRATRVIASRRGEGRATGLEAPFVGRDGQMRLIKDLFHAAGDERKARLVSILGIAGIGKTRLSAEFERYIDGLIDDVYWHRGRCLAYGEGVAYWALAEMVRMRAGIAEQEAPETAARKLHETLERHVLDSDERIWVEPRLAQLLGLAEEASTDREDLFAAWRFFFERLAEQDPTVLVFEDLQWADTALLEFVDYLLDWSRNYPLFVLALARPELSERHGSWGATKRDFTSITLEPLSHDAMDELLAGLAPGLPEELRARIRERAEGVPLYAVETVRMLVDRGLLRREGEAYATTGPVESLEVPETLHALIAARLDDLGPVERRVIADASVLGKSFTRAGLAALTGMDPQELEPVLSTLVRKDLLTLQADPRSPERGNYTFLQALVQRIAHDTLSRKEQKARHLAAARYFEESWAEEAEIVEVIAAHYLDAYRADPDASDAGEIRAAAREALVRAARRAASLAATEQAQSYFEQAAELAEEPIMRAGLLEQAGVMAEQSGRAEAGVKLFEAAIALFAAEGLSHPAARVEAKLASVLWDAGQIDIAAERMTRSFEILRGDEPDEDLAMLAAQLGRFRWFTGNHEAAVEPLEFALEIAESLFLPEVLAEALNSKNLFLMAQGRRQEADALLRHSLRIAQEHGLQSAAFRAQFNLAYHISGEDRYEEAQRIDREALELARRRGDRVWEWAFLGHFQETNYLLGNWEELEATDEEIAELLAGGTRARLDVAAIFPHVYVNTGRLERLQRLIEVLHEPSAEIQDTAAHALALSAHARAEGRHADALAKSDEVLDMIDDLGVEHPFTRLALADSLEAAFELGDLDSIARRLEEVRRRRPADQLPFQIAQVRRFEALLSARAGESDVAEQKFRGSAALLREISARFYLAVVLLEHGEWLFEAGRPEEAGPLLSEAREVFERLQAAPWLERLDALAEPARA